MAPGTTIPKYNFIFSTFQQNLQYFPSIQCDDAESFSLCVEFRTETGVNVGIATGFSLFLFFLPQCMLVNLFLYIVSIKRDWARYLSLNIVNGQQQFRVDDANTSTEIIIE